MRLYFCTVRPMFIIASVRLYVWISCCKDSLRSAEGRSMHFLYYSYCANEQPPVGLEKFLSPFFFPHSLDQMNSAWGVFLFSCCFSTLMSCVFSQRRGGEGGLLYFGVFRLLKQCVCVCVCADTARGNPCTPALLEFTQEGQTVQNER